MSRLSYYAAVIVFALAVGGQAEFQVNTHVASDQIEPAVAMGDEGDFVVVWRSHITDGRGGGVFARRFDSDGNAMGDEFKVNSAGVCVGDWAPAVAMSSSGSIVILWVVPDDDGTCIVARMFDLDGLPLTEEWKVSPSPGTFQSMPSIAMNTEGAFVVVWTDWCGQGYIGRSYVAGRVYDAEGIAICETFRVTDDPQAIGPDVAMDEAGRFVVTWLRSGDLYNRPYGEYVMLRQYRADGTPCGRAAALTENLNSRWYAPSIATGLDGRFVVTWAIGPFPYDIFAQSLDSACSPITEPYLVNTIMDGNQGHPRIATSGQGDYLIVWDSHEPDGSCCVCGQFLTQDGELPGGELLLSTPTGGLNWYPDAAMTSDGRYVVVWVGQQQEGSDYDIFAQTGMLE